MWRTQESRNESWNVSEFYTAWSTVTLHELYTYIHTPMQRPFFQDYPQVSQYQKCETNVDFTEARGSRQIAMPKNPCLPLTLLYIILLTGLSCLIQCIDKTGCSCEQFVERESYCCWSYSCVFLCRVFPRADSYIRTGTYPSSADCRVRHKIC